MRGQLTATSIPISIDMSFHPTHVFTFSRRIDDKDRVVLLSTKSHPVLVDYDIDSQATTTTIPEMETCLAVSQTKDHRSLVMLDRGTVCILHLETMSIKKRIHYKIDFEEVLQMPEWSFSKLSRQREGGYDDRRMLSDDGQTILLAWDSKQRQPILVTPATEQWECEAMIRDAGDSLSENCQLTREGLCTLFIDMDELSKGRLVIGLYSHRDLRVRYNVCVLEDIPPSILEVQKLKQLLSSTFYNLSDDRTEIKALTVSDEDFQSEDFSLKREIKRLNIYATEECIPDYDRFVRSRKTSASQKVQQLFERFGSGHVFNSFALGRSIFAEAFERGNEDITHAISELAKLHSFKLTYFTSIDDLHTLIARLEADGRIEDAINLLTSGNFSAEEMRPISSNTFRKVIRNAPGRIFKALFEDEFVVELCRMEIDENCLDDSATSSSANNVFAMNEVLDWVAEKDPKILTEKWKSRQEAVGNRHGRDDYCPKRMVSLKLIALANAATFGSYGIIRHLLLNGAPESVFKCKVVKWIILHKWYAIWRPRFKRRATVHVAFLVVLTVYAILIASAPELADADLSIQVLSSGLVYVIIAYGLLMTSEEARQFLRLLGDGGWYHDSARWGLRYYFNSKWNWADVTSCLLLVILIPLFHFLTLGTGFGDQALSAFVATEAILGYIKMWYYAQPFTKSGALVLMIENIIRDCIIFLTLLAIVMMGFSLALHVLFRSIASGDNRVDDVADSFGNFQNSLLTLFYALFGNFDEMVYSSSHRLSWMVIVIFSLYMISQSIVLLNLLIAMMTDTFDRVKSNEEGQMLMARAMIIDSCEASYIVNEEKVIQYDLFICAVENVDGDPNASLRDQWLGRINRLEESFKAIARTSEDRMRTAMGEEVMRVRNDISALDCRITKQDADSNEMREEIRQLTAEQAALRALAEHNNRENLMISEKLDRILALLEHQVIE